MDTTSSKNVTSQTEFCSKVYDFTQNHVQPIAEKIDQTDQFPRELWPKLGAAGLLGLTISPQFGGQGETYTKQTQVIEILSEFSASVGLSYAAHANLCLTLIDHFGTQAQKNHYLPKLISGQHIGALAMSERTAGSDVISMKLTATDAGDHFILNGHKMWITNGTEADILLVYAKTNPEAGAKGITCFFIEKNLAGFSTEPALDKLGMRGTGTCQLNFNNCAVPKANVLGQVNEGIKVLMSGLDVERAILCGGPLGVMKACLNLVIPYAKSRHQFGKSIGDFQLIQQKLADMYTAYHAAHAYTYATTFACDNKTIKSEQAAAAYLFSAEQSIKVILETIQCLGGIGYLNDCIAGRLLRDAKLFEIGGGTSEIRRVIIARELLKE